MGDVRIYAKQCHTFGKTLIQSNTNLPTTPWKMMNFQLLNQEKKVN